MSESPTLIDASLELWGDRGELLDNVTSYTALRSVGTQRDRFVLNNRSVPAATRARSRILARQWLDGP